MSDDAFVESASKAKMSRTRRVRKNFFKPKVNSETMNGIEDQLVYAAIAINVQFRSFQKPEFKELFSMLNPRFERPACVKLVTIILYRVTEEERNNVYEMYQSGS